jgi:hypothetical protein
VLAEMVERVVAEAAGTLLEGARVQRFLPLHAERVARQRLRAQRGARAAARP